MVKVTKQEVKKVFGVLFILLSFGLMQETIKEFVTSSSPLTPFMTGLAILLLGVWFFEIA